MNITELLEEQNIFERNVWRWAKKVEMKMPISTEKSIEIQY